MKVFYVSMFLLFSIACTQPTDPIEGEWKLNSRFYSGIILQRRNHQIQTQRLLKLLFFHRFKKTSQQSLY